MFRDPDFGKKLKNQKSLLLLSIPFVVYVLIFNYVPLFGWIMAFQRYKPRDGLFHSEFIGLENFKFLFRNSDFIMDVRNTLAMGVINLVLGTICPIVFAILLSELRFNLGKRVVQTISYLPHFLSMIILTGIAFDVLSMENGTINNLLLGLGLVDKPVQWLAEPQYFWWVVAFAQRWKETGWDSLI